MKKQALLFNSILLFAISVTVILSQVKDNTKKRSDYESFITEAAKEFGQRAVTREGEKSGEDRPDEAAFSEYIKTMDPALRRVPAERRVEALEETERIARTRKHSIWVPGKARRP
jgi:hypothetical protein